MGADQKVELQPADPEEIRTGGDPTVTQEQINTTPDRLLGRRRILRDTREKIGSLLPFNTLNRIKKSPYAKPFWEIGTRLGLAALLALTAVEAVQKYLIPTAEATSPITFYHDPTPTFKKQSGVKTLSLTVDQLTNSAIDYSEATYVNDCQPYAHVAGKPEVQIGRPNRHNWIITYFTDVSGAKMKADDPTFRSHLNILAQTASNVATHYHGFQEVNQIYPQSVPLSKTSSGYTDLSKIVYEIRDKKIIPLDTMNGFPTLDIVIVGSNYYGDGGVNLGSSGILGISEADVDNYDQNSSVIAVVHEEYHQKGLGHISTEEDPRNFMNPIDSGGIDHFNKSQTSLLCSGGRVYLPASANSFHPLFILKNYLYSSQTF